MSTEKPETKKHVKRRKNSVKFSKIIIASVLAAVFLFTAAMVFIYSQFGGVPDTLIVSFFSFAGGEAGVLGLIKCTDTKKEKKESDGSKDIAAG